MQIMSPEMESLSRLVLYIVGMVSGVYAIKRSVDIVTYKLAALQASVETVKGDVQNLKACDTDLQNHAAQMKILMEVGAEYRINVDKVHSELFSKVNDLNSRVKTCETCNDFIRRDIDDVRKKIDKMNRGERG